MLMTGFHIIFVLINIGVILLIPLVFYFIIKLAVKNGINESKLIKNQQDE